MDKRNIIVVGASAGGFDALKELVSSLPAELDAAIFIVWHMAPQVFGVLPQVLNRLQTIPAANAMDREPIVFNRIYVAPPDRHLVIEKGFVRITRGPKENRFRPAVDPLFRSAAHVYGSSVIGIILSGGLDDGTAGLWSIKHHGGVAMVQHPSDAEVPSMPQSALRFVKVDYSVPVSEMSPILQALVTQIPKESKLPNMDEQKKIDYEVRVAKQELNSQKDLLRFHEFTPFACPECHGVLSAIKDGDIIRYRCHTGHAFSADSLLASITENIEETLWSTIRGIDECIILLNTLGDHFAHRNQPKLAALYFKKAAESEARSKLIRQAVLDHEQLTTESIKKEVDDSSSTE